MTRILMRTILVAYQYILQHQNIHQEISTILKTKNKFKIFLENYNEVAGGKISISNFKEFEIILL